MCNFTSDKYNFVVNFHRLSSSANMFAAMCHVERTGQLKVFKSPAIYFRLIVLSLPALSKTFAMVSVVI